MELSPVLRRSRYAGIMPDKVGNSEGVVELELGGVTRPQRLQRCCSKRIEAPR